MKKLYAVVLNENSDPKIKQAVKRLFDRHGNRMPLNDFRSGLEIRLQQHSPIEVISLEKTPLAVVGQKYKATPYRVINHIVYKIDPENS